jgi:hypothetical protein
MKLRRLAPLLALLLLLVPASPAAAKKKKDAKPGELPSEVCNQEGVKLGPRYLFFEVAFPDVKVQQRVRDKGSFCFDLGDVHYQVTPSLSKDRIGFVDVTVRRTSVAGDKLVDLNFHVHDEQFIDSAMGWPEHVRFSIERIQPPLNRSMVSPRSENGTSTIRQ